MSKKKQDTVSFHIRLTEEENEKLEQCAAMCGLSQSEFVRQLVQGKTPKPQPSKDFWGMMQALYSLHDAFESCVSFYPQATEECRKIEQLVLKLQEAM